MKMEDALIIDTGSVNPIYRACVDILDSEPAWPDEVFDVPSRGMLIRGGIMFPLTDEYVITGEC